MAEWLRRWTRNPGLGSPCAGSNPADYVSGQFIQSEQTNFLTEKHDRWQGSAHFYKMFQCLFDGRRPERKERRQRKKLTHDLWKMPTSISGCLTPLFRALNLTVCDKNFYTFHLRSISLNVWRFCQSPQRRFTTVRHVRCFTSLHTNSYA